MMVSYSSNTWTFKTYNGYDITHNRYTEFSMLDIGNGFQVKTMNEEHLRKHNLLGKDVLHFVNELCILVDDHHDALPKDEWVSLEFTLRTFMVGHDKGELYHYLLHAFGPAAMNLNTWTHFSLDMDWLICVRTFRDMPTAILEEYGRKMWRYRVASVGKEGLEDIYKAISARSDTYGQLPREMVAGILFET